MAQFTFHFSMTAPPDDNFPGRLSEALNTNQFIDVRPRRPAMVQSGMRAFSARLIVTADSVAQAEAHVREQVRAAVGPDADYTLKAAA